MMKLHTHNSIPNYFDNADEGCPICIRNLAISDTLKQVDEIVWIENNNAMTENRFVNVGIILEELKKLK
jgi:hypothetical protein